MLGRLKATLALIVGIVLFSGAAGGATPAVEAVSPDIVISQVYGGGGNSGATLTHDFIELFNRGTTTVSLAGWSVQYASAAGSFTQLTPLSGSIPAGRYYLVQQAVGAGGTAPLPTPDATGTIPMSATAGKIALATIATNLACSDGATCAPQAPVIKDMVGYGLTAPLSLEGPSVGALSNTTAASRNGNGCTDTDNNAPDFTVGAPAPRNSLSATNLCGGGDAAPSVITVAPANAATGVALTANVVVTFSEPVNVVGAWSSLACSISGAKVTTVSGGPTVFTLDPTADFVPGDNCTLNVLAASVADQDVIDPPDTMAANFTSTFSTAAAASCTSFTPIYSIQGSGPAAAITGSVTTKGVVVGDYEGPSPTLRGFYIQDETGDGNVATSDGIFVFNQDNNNVSLGQVVLVTGNAAEFQDQTQITATAISQCGTGTVAPADVTFPTPDAAYLERFEGMLVRLPQTLYVTEHFQLGRFGQVLMSSQNPLSPTGRLQQPTNVVAPGAPAIALQAANNLNKILIDDALQNQNPDPIIFGRGGNPLSASNTLRGGDTATGIVGVMTYTWAGNAASGNAYRVRPVNALGVAGVPNFQPANPRPAVAPAVGGSLKVVGMNLLNLFNTFDGLPDTVDNCTGGVGGVSMDCRGADTQAEFDRQWPKTVAAILAMNPDVIGINEIENDGYGPTSTIQFLIDRLNAATAPGTFAFIDVDTRTVQVNAMGTDAIKVGMLYKPGKVTPVGSTGALNSVAFVNGGDDFPRSRPALAQAFQENANGQVFIAVTNHLKSKGSACNAPDAGDGQGNCNQVRKNAATALMAWLGTNPTGTGDPDVLLIGDYNSYAKEEPITIIKNAGYTNLVETLLGANAYSYVFDGQWGYLDHALASASLTPQIAGVADYHINADEPSVLDFNTDFKSAGQIVSLYAPDQFRVSDHDSVLIGLNLAGSLTDSDGDGVPDFTDNCDFAANPGQQDSDNDDIGDACDAGGLIPESCQSMTFVSVIQGTTGNDNLLGTPGNDLILARSGDDIIDGNGGNDCIDGGTGNDTIVARDGNDVIIGGGSNDNINAGGGNNVVKTGPGNDSIRTGAGVDQIDDTGGNNFIQSGGGGDSIVTKSGNDTICTGTFTTFGDIATCTGAPERDVINAGGGNNRIQAGNGGTIAAPQQVTTESGNDQVWTGDGVDHIDAGGGNNQVDAGAGNDAVSTKSGNDTINCGPGTDIATPGGGNNTNVGGACETF